MTEEKSFVIFIHGLFSTTLLKGNDIVYPIEPVNVIKIYIKNLYDNYIKNIISKKNENVENDKNILNLCIDKILDKNLKPGILLDHYNNIINLIKKICGKNYYVYTYDWRDDINIIIDNFNNELNKLEITNKNITIIGHSAGGLIAYKYVNQEKYNNDNKNFQKINKIICIGSPIQGSIKALSTVFGLYKEFFLNSEEIQKIINTDIIKSIFQLFPSCIHNLFFYNNTKVLLKQEEYKKVLYKYGFDDIHLNMSIEFRKEMNEIEQNKNIDMLFITGVYPKKPMCVGFALDNNLDNMKCIYDYGAGDGTVLINESTPFVSKNFRQRFVIGKHKYLTEYDETLNIIETEILSKEYINEHVVSNIINREKNKDKKLLEFMLFLNKNNTKYLIKDFVAEKITFNNKTYTQDITKTIYQSKKINIFGFKTEFKYGILKIKNGYFTYYLDKKNVNDKDIDSISLKFENENDEEINTNETKNVIVDKDQTETIFFKHMYVDLQQLNFYEYLI